MARMESPVAASVAAPAAAEPPPTLQQACTALWLATLSLMTAFMQTAAPAHRYLLARRIARNFTTLREQECYSDNARASFAKLAQKWERKAQLLSPHREEPQGVFVKLQRWLWAR
jgi:hypothetical protein